MTAGKAVAGIGVLLLLSLIGIAAYLISEGASTPGVIGVLIGVALGGLNLFGESVSLSWALRKKPSWTLGLSLGGFLLRMTLVVVLTLVFHGVESVGAGPFALTYAASFLAGIAVQIWVVSRVMKPSGPAGSE